MKILYFDCGAGVSGDMVLKALCELSGRGDEVREAMDAERFTAHLDHVSHTDHTTHTAHADHADHTAHAGHTNHDHGHGRSYADVRSLIENSAFSRAAKDVALNIYGHIAGAEAKVHGADPDTVHFHEVGRDEAVKNALGIGMALEAISPDRVEVSDIWDGQGTITCSHGEIPVPVPAVMALREKCDYVFRTADVDTEMVTPSGLAALMGMGARPRGEARTAREKAESDPHGAGAAKAAEDEEIVRKAEARGARDTGLGGLKAFVIETGERK